jgi:hypothetical protein
LILNTIDISQINADRAFTGFVVIDVTDSVRREIGVPPLIVGNLVFPIAGT